MLALGEQLSIQLNVAYSIPGQPLTISSLGDSNDASSPDNPTYDLFCAIATAACTAFANVPPEERPLSRSTTADTSAVPRSNHGSDRTAHAHAHLRGSTEASGSGSASTPQKRKRSTLSMSTERHTTTGTIVHNSVSNELTTSNEEQARAAAAALADRHENETTEEPLFSSNSQEDRPGGSQRTRLTQREALELAGLDDFDDDDLLGALEDGDEEQEREMQEEMASQRARVEGQGGMEMDGTLGGIPAIGGPGLAGGEGFDMSVDPSFELDTDIFGDPAEESALEANEAKIGDEVQLGRAAGSQRRRSHGSPIKEGEDDESMDEDFAQSQLPTQKSRVSWRAAYMSWIRIDPSLSRRFSTTELWRRRIAPTESTTDTNIITIIYV